MNQMKQMFDKNSVRNTKWEGNMYQGHGGYEPKKGWSLPDSCYKEAEDCSYQKLHEFPKVTIYINDEVRNVIRYLCATVKVEWQMLLLGTVSDNMVTVTGYWIPKQVVTGSSVRNDDVINASVIAEKGIVAGIHSHSNMGVFFSPTDKEATNKSLIRYNVVTNNRGEYEAISRHDLPCGLYKFQEADVMFLIPEQTVAGLENISTTPTVIDKNDEGGQEKWNFMGFKKKNETGIPSNLRNDCFCEVDLYGNECRCTCALCKTGYHLKPTINHAILRDY